MTTRRNKHIFSYDDNTHSLIYELVTAIRGERKGNVEDFIKDAIKEKVEAEKQKLEAKKVTGGLQ
jgi:hypothetical protein